MRVQRLMEKNMLLRCGCLVGALSIVAGCGSTAVEPVPTGRVDATEAAEPTIQADEPLTATVAAEENSAEPVPESAITLQPKNWAEVEQLIAEQKGKVVVVDVWSTSCEPCLREFPRLVALQKQYGERVVCIGLNCDYVGIKKKPPEFYREKVTKTLEGMDARLVNVLCTMPSDDLFAALKIDSIPAVFIYDVTGKKVHTFDNRTPAGDGEGISYEKQVEPAVAALLK